MSWHSFWDSQRRHRTLERDAERHICEEYGVYIHWTSGPYTDGTTYQQAWAFKPTPGDRVGTILDEGVGRTKAKALLALHAKLKGRPDFWQRWMLDLQFRMRQDGEAMG